MAKLRRVEVLVDWHNIESVARGVFQSQDRRYFQTIILWIQEEVSKLLKKRDSTVKYRATMRVYHGWHREDRPTGDRSRFEAMKRSDNFGRSIGIVSYAPELKFGNELACDTPRNPLLNTSRAQGQKMVDSAAICDLLYLLREGLSDTVVVVSDDDDFLPAVFTAESWGLDSVLLRSVGNGISDVCRGSAGKVITYWGSHG